jgi:nucleoid-associated protein YgaU
MEKNMKKSLFAVTAILVSLFLLVSCASGSKKAVAKEEPMKVTNTEPKPASTKAPDTNGTTAKPTYIDSGINNINEPGMTVTDDSANQDKLQMHVVESTGIAKEGSTPSNASSKNEYANDVADKNTTGTEASSSSGKTAATYTHPRGHIVLDNAQFYTVKRGDVLILIAERFYGNGKGNYFPFIIAGTEDEITDADLIEIGQKLTIPDLQKALSTEESRNYVKQTFYSVADKYDSKGKPGMAAQLRAIAAGL